MPGPSTNPSVLDRVIARIDRLPVPNWVVYLGIYLVGAVMYHAALWRDGVVDPGAFDGGALVNALWLIVPLGGIHLLLGSAKVAVDRFAPLVADVESFERVKRRMMTTPRWTTLAIYVGWFGFVLSGMISEPEFVYEGLDGPVSFALAALPGLIIGYSVGPLMLLVGWRQVTGVAACYALIDDLDPLQQRRLYAPAGLAMRVGLVFIAILNLTLASTLLTDPTVSELVVSVAMGVVTLSVGIAALVGPVLGIHGRLLDAKRQLLEENAAAVARTRDKVYDALDRDARDEVESLDKGLTSLLRLRDELDRIKTWPWSPGAVRSYASAVFLPLVVWAVQQALTGGF